MKKMLKNLATVFMAGLLIALAACKTEVVEEVAAEQDKVPPSKVTELSVSAANGKAVLTWTNPTESDFFGTEITISPETEGVTSSFCIEGQPGQKSSAFINGLENGREYIFSLTALDKNQNKADCETIQETTAAPASDTTPPADVTGLTVNAANGNAVLSWQNPEDADFAGVKISLEPAAGTLKYPVILENDVETFTVSGLENDVPYTFKIQSFDKNLNFAEGATEGATLEATPVEAGDTTPPADVTNLNATAANGKAVLTWTNPADSDFAGLRLTMTPAEGNLSYPVILSKYATSFAVYELENDKEYSFEIEAFDETLNYSKAVSYSAKSTATPVESSDTTAPADVTNLTVACENGTNGKVNAVLTWTDPGDTDLFGMEVTYAEKTSGRAAITTMAKGSIFVAPGDGGTVINDLTAGKTYTFTVKTMDTNGNKSSGASNTAEMTLSQLSELKITLTASTTEITNQDVTVSVAATTSSTVSKIFYVSAIKTNIDAVLKGTDITSAAKFTATENGTYTVAVIDYDGRREVSYITIENIDKTAPNAPVNLTANYTSSSKTITVTWDTGDSDVDYYLLNCKKNGTAVEKDKKVTGTTYTLNNAASAATYRFTVKAVDKAGNTGNASATSVATTEDILVSKIELSRTHFAYTEKGTEFTATVYGSNFDLISSQTDTTVKVQILDSNGSVDSTFEAVLDAANNKATAILTLPALGSATTAGTDYTVRAKVCDEADEEHTTTFNISDVAEVTGVTLKTTQISVNDVTSGMTTKATVKGTNLDVAGTIALALYDNTGAEYGTRVTVDTSSFTHSTASFEADIPLPAVDDTYTVKVLFADVAQSTTASLQIYSAPVFTDFKIPNAGTIYEDRTVTATVTGKNFKAPGVSETDFSLSCADKISIVKNSVITIVSDSKLAVTLEIPGNAGSYDVTITNGSSSTAGTFTVKNTKNYAVGDILLEDGTNVAAANYESSDTNKPVAVVAGFNANGVVIGLGLKCSSSSLSWARIVTTGYNTSFTDIIAEYNGSTGSGYTFTGDLDGSDNWEYICSVDPEDTKDAAKNYPAFNFAANYGTTTCGFDSNSDLATGWYIPSISELYEIYKIKDTLQTSLSKVNGFTIGTSAYWSSSQGVGYYDYAIKLGFSNSSVFFGSKSHDYYVLVVRAF